MARAFISSEFLSGDMKASLSYQSLKSLEPCKKFNTGVLFFSRLDRHEGGLEELASTHAASSNTAELTWDETRFGQV
jgi:hypothetical protein